MANKKVKGFSLQPKVHTEPVFNNYLSQIEELAEVYGRPAFFIRQTDIQKDDVLLEITAKEFQLKHTIPIFYLNDEDSADLDGSMVYGGFNLIPLYQKIIYVPVSYFNKIKYTPVSGDLIYLPENNQEEMLFEITKDPVREQDHRNSKNGRIFAYKLFLKLYTNDRGNVDLSGQYEDVSIPDDMIVPEEDLQALQELADALDQTDSPVMDNIPSMKKQREEIKKLQQDIKKGRFEDL